MYVCMYVWSLTCALAVLLCKRGRMAWLLLKMDALRW